MQEIRVVTNHRHLIEVTSVGDEFDYRVVCPDSGKNCECWQECAEEHRCDCGPHPHDDQCEPGCTEDHALDCDEWMWNGGDLHGEEHQFISGMVCVKAPGCWMPMRDIEFDHLHDWRPGLYEFDYEEPDEDTGGCLYVVAMRPFIGDNDEDQA